MTTTTPEVTPPKPKTLGFIAAVVAGAFAVGVAVRLIGERLPLPGWAHDVFVADDDDQDDEDGDDE